MADSVWPFVRWAAIWTQMAFCGTQVRQDARCCMCGANYVKLSRCFAVQLFSAFIAHYTAPPPSRFSVDHMPHVQAQAATQGGARAERTAKRGRELRTILTVRLARARARVKPVPGAMGVRVKPVQGVPVRLPG